MKIPKGGLHNINQSSQANINDSWNVLATDENNAVLIAVDKCGNKKTVGDTSGNIRFEEKSNKQNNLTADGTGTKYPTVDAVNSELNNKLNKGSLTSNDDSLLIEGENIEVQLSIYSEEFEQKIFNLTFTPINILGVYKNGICLRTSEFILNLPKSITINNYNTNDIVIVQYQHLKTDI